MTNQTITGPIARLWLIVLGAIIIAAGLFFVIGGSRLAWLGGSWYFLLAGLALIASGVLTIRRWPAGPALFGLVLVATAIWAVAEIGWQFWPLVSRLFAMAVGGIVVAASVPLLTAQRAQRRAAWASAAVLGIGVVATAISAFSPKNVIPPTETATAAPSRRPARRRTGATGTGRARRASASPRSTRSPPPTSAG